MRCDLWPCLFLGNVVHPGRNLQQAISASSRNWNSSLLSSEALWLQKNRRRKCGNRWWNWLRVGLVISRKRLIRGKTCILWLCHHCNDLCGCVCVLPSSQVTSFTLTIAFRNWVNIVYECFPWSKKYCKLDLEKQYTDPDCAIWVSDCTWSNVVAIDYVCSLLISLCLISPGTLGWCEVDGGLKSRLVALKCDWTVFNLQITWIET